MGIDTPELKETPSQFNGVLDIAIPFETIPLPSRGLVYPEDHPFYQLREVDIKCMTTAEEDILYSAALVKAGRALDELIKACLMIHVDTDTLLAADRNAIAVAIRISGYGSEYEATVTCPSCDEEFDELFSMNNLPIKELDKGDVIRLGENAFSCKLPKTGFDVTFKLATGADENALIKAAKTKKRMGMTRGDTMTRRLMQAIISVATPKGQTENRAEIKRFLNAMPAADGAALRAAIKDVEPKLELVQPVVCKFCDHEAELEIPLSAKFFWPSFES